MLHWQDGRYLLEVFCEAHDAYHVPLQGINKGHIGREGQGKTSYFLEMLVYSYTAHGLLVLILHFYCYVNYCRSSQMSTGVGTLTT